MTTKKEKIEKCIRAGVKAGCPRDQVDRFINASYIPFPWQWQFHSDARQADETGGPVDIGLGGARGPGKSHAVLSQTVIDDCQRIAGLKCLFLRQTGTAAKESFDDLVDKVVRGHVEYRKTANNLKFPNGSRVLLGGFHDQRDIDKYIGIEYDVIIVEELNQLTKEKYDQLRGSLRTSKEGWRPRMYTSFNPGGIGHSFVKERYVIPYRKNEQTETRFVPSTYKSNPALNVGYIEYLEGLEGDLGKAWREGEWDLFAGQYFTEWNFKMHTCPPREIPLSWFRFRSIDISGNSGVTSCHWYAIDNDGRVYNYREYYKTGRDYAEHAQNIYKMSCDEDDAQEQYRYTVIDSSAFAKSGFSETPAEIYEKHGVTGLIPSAKDRIPGWTMVHQYLKWDALTKPKLQIFSTSDKIIKEIAEAQHDEKNPEDVASINIPITDSDGRKGNSHQDAIDDLRYFLRTLRDAHTPKIETPIQRKLRENMQRENQNYNYNYSRGGR